MFESWVGILNLVLMLLIILYLKKLPKDLDGAVARLDHKIDSNFEQLSNNIKEVRSTVVFTDVFEQFSETQNAKYEMMTSIYALMQEQIKSVSSINSREHDKICGKMDAIPSMIKEELDRVLSLCKISRN